jgi:urease accessory protein UreF
MKIVIITSRITSAALRTPPMTGAMGTELLLELLPEIGLALAVTLEISVGKLVATGPEPVGR